MDKILKYMNENDIDTIIDYVLSNNKDLITVSLQIAKSRTDYQIKTQEIQNRLREHFPEWKVGDTLIAIEDIPTLKIKMEQSVIISEIRGVMYTLNDDGFNNSIAQASEMIVRGKFRKVG